MTRFQTAAFAVLSILCSSMEEASALSESSRFQDVTSFVSAGYGLRGGSRSIPSSEVVPIDLSGISSSDVVAAYLYYHGLNRGSTPSLEYASTSSLDGTSVTGVNVGRIQRTPCWGSGVSDTYRADITSIVQAKKDGSYSWVSGAPGFEGDGVSIIAILNDGGVANKEVVIYDGNDEIAFGATSLSTTFNGITCTALPCDATLELHVSDGQDFTDGSISIDGNLLQPAGPIFQGDTTPPIPKRQNGNLWDIVSWDVSTFVSPGTDNLNLETQFNNDCLHFAVGVVEFERADTDGDGVFDDEDECLGTSNDAPEKELKPNHFIFGPDDFVKGETKGNGGGTNKSFTIQDTRGCSCEQIIEQLGLGSGHRKFGCSPGVMDCWVNGNCGDDIFDRNLRG